MSKLALSARAAMFDAPGTQFAPATACVPPQMVDLVFSLLFRVGHTLGDEATAVTRFLVGGSGASIWIKPPSNTSYDLLSGFLLCFSRLLLVFVRLCFRLS